MKPFVVLFVLAFATSSVLSLRTDQTMAALEELESLLNQQLLSEIVQQQEYDETAAKEELLGVLQRACNRGGSEAVVQSLTALADMLDRDVVSTQEAVDVIQQGGGLLGGLLSGVLGGGKSPAPSDKAPLIPPAPATTPAPSIKNALKNVAAKKIKQAVQRKVAKNLANKLINEKASTIEPKNSLVKAIEGAAKKPQQLFDILAGLQNYDEELADEENYDLRGDVDAEDYDLFNDAALENYDLLDDVESEDYEEAVAEENKVQSQFLGLLNMLG